MVHLRFMVAVRSNIAIRLVPAIFYVAIRAQDPVDGSKITGCCGWKIGTLFTSCVIQDHCSPNAVGTR